MDFMHDQLSEGRSVRLINEIDDFNREALAQLIEWRGKPAAIRCDNGPEYTSKQLMSWAAEQK